MSNNILEFSLNRCTSVETLEDGSFIADCTFRDTHADGRITLRVSVPGLEIQSAQGYFHHAYLPEIADLDKRLESLVNVRVGSGMLKIIKGLIGSDPASLPVVTMVEEACHGVILSLTKKVLLKAPDDLSGKERFYSDMVKKSIRLYDRCAAFAKGSPLVREYEAENGLT